MIEAGEEKSVKLEDTNNALLEKLIPSKFHLDDKGFIPEKTKRTYHEQRLSQSKWAFRLSFWGSIAGFMLIVISLFLSITVENAQWAGLASGTIIEAVSALFYTLSNKANEKISEFFVELTKDSNVSRALLLSEEIKDEKIKDELRVKLSLYLVGIDEEKICKNVNETCKKNIE